jgi:hypothetical protein
MSANALILWMSARRQGSWQRFRTAVEELHFNVSDATGREDDDLPDQLALPLYQELRLNFQRVGHAEFFAGAGGVDWRVTPPTFAITQTNHGWLGVFVGARSSKLLQRLFAVGTTVRIETTSSPTYPDQISVFAESIDILSSLAQTLNVSVQIEAPTAILSCLPPIDAPPLRNLVPLPYGKEWKIDRFNVDQLQWRSGKREEAHSSSAGLFRFSLRHQQHMLFCSKGKAYRIAGQVGKYLVMKRRRRVLRYDSHGKRLSLPASCRPPFLIERALILCTGSLPIFSNDSGNSTIEYVGVSQRTAEMVAGLLRQELT